MDKLKVPLLIATSFFSILVIALFFNVKNGEEIILRETIQRETVLEEIKEDTAEGKTDGKEVIKKEESEEASIEKINGTGKSGESEDYYELNWQWVGEQKKLYSLTSAELNLILTELKQRFPEKPERLKAISFLRLGTPYQLGCLGEEAGRDKNPIFRIDVADCTVFVLTNVALLHSETITEAREMMRFLNYQPDSEISFESRLHFTTDRNSVSPYFRDITEEIAGEKGDEFGNSSSLLANARIIQKKTVILNKKRADGTRLIDIGWEREMILKYIPSQHIAGDFLASLPEVVVIAFIREGDEEIGLDIRHEGFLFDGKTLIHASSAQGGVEKESFLDYYFIDQKTPRFDGIMLFEIN